MVAIEGNTMTLEEVVKTLAIGARIPGRSQREHDEVKGLDEALAFIEENRIKVEEINLEVVFFCFVLMCLWLIRGGRWMKMFINYLNLNYCKQ
jgi:hypothetical protein